MQDVVYIEAKKTNKAKKEKKSKKGQEDEIELSKVPSKEFIPKRLTLEVGFGLKRNYCI